MKKLLLSLGILPVLTTPLLTASSLSYEEKQDQKNNSFSMSNKVINSNEENQENNNLKKVVKVSQVEDFEIINSILKTFDILNLEATNEQVQILKGLKNKGLQDFTNEDRQAIFDNLKQFAPIVENFDFLLNGNTENLKELLVNLVFDLLKPSDEQETPDSSEYQISGKNNSKNPDLALDLTNSSSLKESIDSFFHKLLHIGFKDGNDLFESVKSFLIEANFDLAEEPNIENGLLSSLAVFVGIDLSYGNLIKTISTGIFSNEDHWYNGLFEGGEPESIVTLGLLEAFNPFEGIQPKLLKEVFQKGLLNAEKKDFNDFISFFQKLKDLDFISWFITDEELMNSMNTLLSDKNGQALANIAYKVLKEDIGSLQKNDYDSIVKILTSFFPKLISENDRYVLVDLVRHGFKSTHNATQTEKVFVVKKIINKFITNNNINLPIDLNLIFDELFSLFFEIDGDQRIKNDTKNMLSFLRGLKPSVENNSSFTQEHKEKFFQIFNSLENVVNDKQYFISENTKDFIEVRNILENVLKR